MPSLPEPREQIRSIGTEVRDEFLRNQRVMSFDEYYSLVTRDPLRHVRSSAQYLLDVVDHFGCEEVRSPVGPLRRFRLFDGLPGESKSAYVRLAGQEEVQNHFYRILSNFVREGRSNKIILLHGPNGSAKSTFVECVARALEAYSSLDVGALYRFNWVFPSEKYTKSGIGFSGGRAPEGGAETFAYLGDDLVDTRLRCELKDHPLLLIPAARRRAMLEEALQGVDAKRVFSNDQLLNGDLCVRCKQVYEALLTANQGDYLRVLRHVQVERFYLSRRYRVGLVEVEPQLSVDASSHQITVDRSLSALPAALQCVSLFEFGGALVEANRGMIVYSELLKRPLEAYKYLLTTVEQGRVGLDAGMVHLDTVYLASSNEAHLAAFKEIAEFPSFKARMELVRVPYLLDYTVEGQIYEEQILSATIGKHIAPHTTFVAALWAVLTRMRKPLVEKYPRPIAEIVQKLSPLQKAELYARGLVPTGISSDVAAELRASIERVYRESDAYPNYEGRTGASPREIKTVLLNAAQREGATCLSPVSVFEELEELVRNVTVYDFLRQEPLSGGYHENRKFIDVVRDRYLEIVDDEVRASMGLVDDAQHLALLGRYVTQVNHWVRNEKVRNPMTGEYADPDEALMADVERTLGVGPKKSDFRSETIAAVGAWGVDHPGKKPDLATIFPQHLDRLRESYYEQQRKTIRKTLDDIVLSVDAATLSKESQQRVSRTLEALRDRYGYCDACSREAAMVLCRKRYA